MTENAYDIVKADGGYYTKKHNENVSPEIRFMACVMLHNFCIHPNDICNPRWKLSVEELELNVGITNKQQNKRESNENATKIANWLWQHTLLFFKINYMFSHKFSYVLLILWFNTVTPYVLNGFSSQVKFTKL